MSVQPIQALPAGRAPRAAWRSSGRRAALAASCLAMALAASSAGAQDGAPGTSSGPLLRPLGWTAGEPAAGPRSTQSGREAVALLIDRAKVVRLPERTQTVIVGNPLIADVALQRNGVAVLTGKSYGVTNLIALDGSGGMLAESLVNVQAPTETVVTVQRGLERETYSCNPHCQRSLLLGDSNTYFTEVGAQAERRNALATQR